MPEYNSVILEIYIVDVNRNIYKWTEYYSWWVSFYHISCWLPSLVVKRPGYSIWFTVELYLKHPFGSVMGLVCITGSLNARSWACVCLTAKSANSLTKFQLLRFKQGALISFGFKELRYLIRHAICSKFIPLSRHVWFNHIQMLSEQNLGNDCVCWSDTHFWRKIVASHHIVKYLK